MTVKPYLPGLFARVVSTAGALDDLILKGGGSAGGAAAAPAAGAGGAAPAAKEEKKDDKKKEVKEEKKEESDDDMVCSPILNLFSTLLPYYFLSPFSIVVLLPLHHFLSFSHPPSITI